jgi:hypothetical protein
LRGDAHRHLYEDIAFEAAGTIYRQWGDARKRLLFKTRTGSVFQVVRNTFLSRLRKAGNRPELHRELPGEEDRAFWKKVAEDPGYEVRRVERREATARAGRFLRGRGLPRR